MKIKLLWVGKEDGGVFDDAIREYARKLAFYCDFETLAVPYLKNAKSMSQEEQKRREGELLLKRVESGDHVILLDERGREYTSENFAQLLQRHANSGLKSLVFIIGGAYGFSEMVYARGNARMSLSQMTFPHIMTRLIFTEQLYRAFTILHGEPYHHK